MDNNNLFNTTPPGADILNTNNQPAVNDLLTQGYGQPSSQPAPAASPFTKPDPLGPSGGQYSSNFGQDAFALRESMNSNAGQSAQPQQNTYSQQNSFSQQNPYSQQASAPTAYTQPQYTQQGFSNTGYSQVPPAQPYGFAPEAEVSVGEWVLTIILAILPCVGQILLLVWAFGGETQPTKKNWARAMLIFMLIGIILSVAFTATIGAAMIRYMQHYIYY